MRVYLDLVLGLNYLVDFLLLMGTNRLAGYPFQGKRCALAAMLGAAYAGVCILPGMAFFGRLWWRVLILGAMSGAAYGFTVSGLRRGVLFALLSMALGGIAVGMQGRGFFSLCASAGGLCILCAAGFRGPVGARRYLPVELRYGGRSLKVTALQDTGNTLTDPLTGRPVLVLGWAGACTLTGLTREQLRNPVQTLGTLPGLRLIPYQSVGQGAGMLLALRIPSVQIGSWKGSGLVAFAPEGLDGAYGALTGGSL